MDISSDVMWRFIMNDAVILQQNDLNLKATTEN